MFNINLKVSSTMSKNDHITTFYRSFKNFNEQQFLHELSVDQNASTPCQANVKDDFKTWFSIILKNLDNHATLKNKRVMVNGLHLK